MQVIGAPIAAGLMMMDGLRGIRGWKWLFLIEGAITVLFGILFFVSAPSQAAHCHVHTAGCVAARGVPSGRPLQCSRCKLCYGKWLFLIKGTISVHFGILLIVNALLIRWGLPSYQP